MMMLLDGGVWNYCCAVTENGKKHVRTAVARCADWCSRRLRQVLRPPIEAVWEAQIVALKKEIAMDLQTIILWILGAVAGYYAVCHFMVSGSAA